METWALGIHHVTAIAGDPQRNLDFHAGTLGMRLVKKTVNFDDPGTYHFYFGDGVGRPGTILTFFPWPRARGGLPGVGQVVLTSLAVPEGTLGWWTERLRAAGAEPEPLAHPDGEAIVFHDPDGLPLALFASAEADALPGWDGGPVPGERSVRGVHAVTLHPTRPRDTVEVLTGTLGLRVEGEADGVVRLAAGEGGPGARAEVRLEAEGRMGGGGAGTVHHVAWRAADDAAELELRAAVRAAGLSPTPVIDRQYFHSVYFREPGGVLFEIATDSPGFTLDEPAEALGTGLMLPPRYEPRRGRIEAALPPVELPYAVGT